MKTFLLLTLAVGLLSTTTQARIGYTLDQCVKEYGPYKTRQSWVGTVYDFHVNDQRITVVILNNLVSAIDYVKPDKVQFNINELDDLLDKNKGNSIWDSPNPNITEGTQHTWLTKSGPELIAGDSPGGFSVLTKAQQVLDIAIKTKQQGDALATADGAERYVQTFYGSGITVDSCSAFVPKTIANVSYLLAKALITVGNSNQQTIGIILKLDSEQRITQTQAMEQNKFYRFVTSGDTALLQQETNLDVNAKPTSTPEAAKEPTVNRDKLRQLISISNSDMSSLSREEVEQAAQLDAQSYYMTHKQKAYERNFAVARALKHNLLGDLALVYQVTFRDTLEALATADAPTD